MSIIMSFPFSSLTGFFTQTVALLTVEMLKLRTGIVRGTWRGVVVAGAHRGSKNSRVADRAAWLRLATARKERAADETLLQRNEAIASVVSIGFEAKLLYGGEGEAEEGR